MEKVILRDFFMALRNFVRNAHKRIRLIQKRMIFSRLSVKN